MELTPLHGEREVAESSGQRASLQGRGRREVGDVRRQNLRCDHAGLAVWLSSCLADWINER